MPAITESEFKEQLSSGRLSRVYAIIGEEKYMVRRAAQRLMKKASGESFLDFNRKDFTNESPVDDIADAVEALPFMADHKCVTVADFNVDEKNQDEIQKLTELLTSPPQETTLIFWYPTLEYDGRKAKWKNFFKQVEAAGSVLICKRRDAAELCRLLLREAEKAGCTMKKETVNLLLDYVGTDLKSLLNEMEKLTAYCNGGEITAQIIEELVPKSTETTVFLMVNALVGGDYERAYRLMDLLFYRNEEPIAILGALSSSYVDMYRVRASLSSGFSSSAPASYGEYKGKEFRLRNGERNSRKLTMEGIKESLHLLLEADMALKGSRMDSRVVLDSLIAKLLLAAREEQS